MKSYYPSRYDARGFYGVMAVSVLAGLVIQYSPISPMEALFWSIAILRVSRNARHELRIGTTHCY